MNILVDRYPCKYIRERYSYLKIEKKVLLSVKGFWVKITSDVQYHYCIKILLWTKLVMIYNFRKRPVGGWRTVRQCI